MSLEEGYDTLAFTTRQRFAFSIRQELLKLITHCANGNIR